MQSHMYCAYVQNPHSSVFPGTFLLFSGNQKINLYSNPVFLEHQFAMNAAESATSWILFCNYCKTDNTRAQQMQVSCLRTVNVDFPKSSYKSIFSCNSDAKYFQDGLLQRNFSRADSGWVKCWWNTAEIQCFAPLDGIIVQTYAVTWLWYAEIFPHFHNFEHSLTQASPILTKHQ